MRPFVHPKINPFGPMRASIWDQLGASWAPRDPLGPIWDALEAL